MFERPRQERRIRNNTSPETPAPAWDYSEQLLAMIGDSRKMILVTATHINTLRQRMVGHVEWDSETAPPFTAIVDGASETREFLTRFDAVGWLKEQWEINGVTP